jgi:hypothetical protein
MKGFVNELVTLVGGNGNGRGQGSGFRGQRPGAREKRKPAAKISHKDTKAAFAASMEVNPKKLILMGDEEFKDF